MTFDGLFVPDPFMHAVSDHAWFAAMLEAERSLASAGAAAGVVPAHLAGRISDACRVELYDTEALVRDGRGAGNPAEPLVRALRAVVGAEAAPYVHLGATSQDIVDSAAMLVARAALDLVLAELDGVAAGCARLAREHRTTPMAARTLLQQAVPTTFGLKAAGWLVAVLAARRRLAELCASGLAAQLGGAAGTLALLGEHGPTVLGLFAHELGLPEPVVPWHTDRTRVAALGAALATAAGSLEKIALDVALLEQTEVGEVSEGEGAGGSSTMPHKRNPAASAIVSACARRARAASGLLLESMVQAHERSAGAWHAEWGALSDALAATGGAAAAVNGLLSRLEPDPARMRVNLDLTGGAVVSERLVRELGRERASGLLEAAARSGRTLRDELEAAGESPGLLDPLGYLGSAGAFVDRALDAYRTALEHHPTQEENA